MPVQDHRHAADGLNLNGQQCQEAIAPMGDIEIANPWRLEERTRRFEPCARGVQVGAHDG